jgi:hypothetical protein
MNKCEEKIGNVLALYRSNPQYAIGMIENIAKEDVGDSKEW